MPKQFIVEITLILVLGLLMFSALNPYWMPMGMQLTVLTALILLFGFYAIYVWRERGGDEREALILTKSDRVAFLAGAGALFVTIIYGSVMHLAQAPWAFAVLGIMILAKVLASVYFQNHN